MPFHSSESFLQTSAVNKSLHCFTDQLNDRKGAEREKGMAGVSGVERKHYVQSWRRTISFVMPQHLNEPTMTGVSYQCGGGGVGHVCTSQSCSLCAKMDRKSSDARSHHRQVKPPQQSDETHQRLCPAPRGKATNGCSFNSKKRPMAHSRGKREQRKDTGARHGLAPCPVPFISANLTPYTA